MDETTRELVFRWVAKAESDWLAIENILAGDRVPWDAVCFHCQQVAEKYLKALLILLDMEFEPVHNLARLHYQAIHKCTELKFLTARLNRLNEYSVHPRYPDDWREIEPDEGHEAVQDAMSVRSTLRELISNMLGENLPAA